MLETNIEQQIEVEVGVADGELVLASDEGKTTTELGEEMGEPTDEGIFEVALAVTGVEAEEVEVVRILQDLVGEVGFVRRKRGGEIVRGGTDTQMPIRTDVMNELARDQP